MTIRDDNCGTDVIDGRTNLRQSSNDRTKTQSTFGVLIEAHADDENNDKSTEKADGRRETGYEFARALHVTQLVSKASHFHHRAVIILPHGLQLPLDFLVIEFALMQIRMAFLLRVRQLGI